MSSIELNYLTAAEALEQFRAKKLSPVEYLRAIIDQCERVNPKVNAFTYTFFERALEQVIRRSMPLRIPSSSAHSSRQRRLRRVT
jgi:Asp-tRNA(Asn)/Glu-tRNA(Gln) amidotransferase A subunit family amidase